MRRSVLLFLVVLTACLLPARAQDATALQVSQAYVDLPKITVFFDVRDGSGRFVRSVQPEQLAVSAGTNQVTVDTTRAFRETGRGVAYVFLVDISKSLRPEQFSSIQEALRQWVGEMEEPDQASVVTFGSEVQVIQDFTAEKDALRSIVDSLELTDNETMLHGGLAQAADLGRRQDADLPRRRAIVILSDGKDDVTGGMTEEALREQMRVDPVPIYAIGYSEPPRSDGDEAALDKLGTLSRTSGGEFIEGGGDEIGENFGELRRQVSQVHIAELNCSACEPDGTVQRLQVQLTAGTNTMTDGLRIRMQSTEDPTAEEEADSNTSTDTQTTSTMDSITTFFAQLPWWGYGLGAALLVGLAAGIYFWVRREEEEEPEMAAQPAPRIKSDPTSEPESPEPKGPPIHFNVVGQQGGDAYEAPLSDRVVVGRSRTECDVALPDDEASRQNSEIVREDGDVYVRDLDSTNGTLVNGVPISGSYKLEDGDRIMVGRTELRVSLPEEVIDQR
jgi:hypothetical protein